jgi:predicted RND superfamily exporter protein
VGIYTLTGIVLLLMWLSRRRSCGFPVAMAVAAAMLLDAIISLGALSAFGVPLSLPIVSSLLAIVGYSVYDSIVIVAHIREQVEQEHLPVDEGVVEALAKLSRRLILTMASTTVSALGMAIFCSGVIHDFGVIMATGSVSGMMSTIAIVVPSAEAAYAKHPGLLRSSAGAGSQEHGSGRRKIAAYWTGDGQFREHSIESAVVPSARHRKGNGGLVPARTACQLPGTTV